MTLTLNYVEFKEFSIRRRGDSIPDLRATLAHVSSDKIKESNRSQRSVQRNLDVSSREVLCKVILNDMV